MTSLVKEAKLKQLTMQEIKIIGLRKRKKETLVKFILEVEHLWEQYAFDRNEENLNKLLKKLKFSIKKKAEYWGNRWKWTKLCRDDFESAFFEATLKLCDEYTHYNEFYFYETLILVLKRKSIDVSRWLTTKKGEFENSIQFLDEDAYEFLPDLNIDIESDLITKDLMIQILNEKTLNQQEKLLLQTMYENPYSSKRELASLSGLNHHQAVSRSQRSIKNKISYLFL